MRWISIPLACLIVIMMSATKSVEAECCPVVELRQYTLKPGKRDVLINLFEREFIEPQEALGMTIVGQFRDRRRPDRFVWLRGFPSMEARRQALEQFYGGPVWAAHRADANNTMVDTDDVLLLKPARPGQAFRIDTDSGMTPRRAKSLVLAGIYQLTLPADASLLSKFEQHVVPVLQANHIKVESVLVTEPAPNTFTALPVREGEHVLVWFGVVEGPESGAQSIERLATVTVLDNHPAQILELEPTSRSILGGGPNAERAMNHDFDFLLGAWNVHHRYLKGRLQGSSQWTEFDGSSEMKPLLNGLGNVDRYWFVRDSESIEGVALRLFNPKKGEWTIYWADTKNPGTLQPPIIGKFHGDHGEFIGEDKFNGRKILCRFRWTRFANGDPQWEQAFSTDEGKTWETNWIMSFTRARKN